MFGQVKNKKLPNILKSSKFDKSLLLKTKTWLKYNSATRTGGRLTEIQLIEIVIFQLIKSFNNESLIFYHLIEFFESFQLIEILK